MGRDMLAYHAERCPHPMAAQEVEHGRRPARVRPVVEGQRQSFDGDYSTLDPIGIHDVGG
jgi:hypothetical protein